MYPRVKRFLLIILFACSLMSSGFNKTSTALAANIEPTSATNPTFAPMLAFQKGITYASWWHGEYSSPATDAELSESIRPLGVNWISIVVTCYQKNVASTQIQCKPKTSTPTDADLIHVIEEAHRLGLRVMLKPHVDLENDPGHWRGQIGEKFNEASWKNWFSSYSDFITHYARLAQDTNADYFVAGTELAKTTQRENNWRAVIKSVRRIYSGPLTYAAHHTGEEFGINWWDTLDAIGVNAYYSLAQDDYPTVFQIKAAWVPIVSRLGLLSEKWGRPIILTEVGYESLEGANQSPWRGRGHAVEGEADLKEQADSYQAVFEAFEGKPWWQGVFWWAWTIDSSHTSPLNNDFTAKGKPAENILRLYYGGQPNPVTYQAPELVAVQKEQLAIYDDKLAEGWKNWSWNSVVRRAFCESTDDKNALQISMRPWGALSLHNPGIDTSPYRWLEFYIYVGKDVAQQFAISFSNKAGKILSRNINLPVPQYLEGGDFAVDQWQRVRIPLLDMDAANTTITRLSIKENAGKHLKELLVREIRLTGDVSLQE